MNTNTDLGINTFRTSIDLIRPIASKKMEISSDESDGLEGGFRPRRFQRRAQRELAVLAIRNQLRDEEFWDLPGEERSFEAARKRHDLLVKIDALKNIEEIEEADHEGFEIPLTAILHETSAVLKLLQEEVYSNWAKKKISEIAYQQSSLTYFTQVKNFEAKCILIMCRFP